MDKTGEELTSPDGCTRRATLVAPKCLSTRPRFPIDTLSDLVHGQEGDFFALLSGKEELTTREGKPYFKVTFRDAAREVSFPIWNDSAWAVECRESWQVGTFFKVRAMYRETNFGPQLEIKKIRAVVEADCRRRLQSADDAAEIAVRAGGNVRRTGRHRQGSNRRQAAARLVIDILKANRDTLLTLPAARKNHHAYVGRLAGAHA